MPVDKALSLVEQAGKLGVFSSVGFTGGEPLLFIDDVCAVAERAFSLGMPTTIATACHWATTPTESDHVIGKLAERGLYRLNVSHDPAHAEFVSSENVVNAALAASRRDIPTYVVGTFARPDERLKDLLPELADHPGVQLVDKYVAKIGRASTKEITQDTYRLRLDLDELHCYRRVYHDLVVFWDGRAYPCCSTFNRATRGIEAGNAFNEPLADIWDRVEGSLALRIMKRQGFGELYRIIAERDPELAQSLPSVEASVGPCSLCHSIFGKQELARRVKEFFSSYEKEKTAHAIDVVEQLLGTERAYAEILSLIAGEANHQPTEETSGPSGVQFLPMPEVRQSD